MAGDEPSQTPQAARPDGTTGQDQLARLPEDVLADIFRRVSPRWLAASRCVCRAWRDAIDSRGLLRADLLPLSLAGLFVHFTMHKYPEFLARPSFTAGARTVSGDLSFLPSASPHCGSIWDDDCVDLDDYNMEDHCNGLLLLTGDYVVNPATRRWYTLPTCPSSKKLRRGVYYHRHLVYDPMLSPYYEVFSISTLDYSKKVDPSTKECEWPPSICKIYVFSSKSGRWEEKDFLREGDAAGTVAEVQASYSDFRSIYFRGALYVQCEDNFLMRLSFCNNTYNVIKPPMDRKVEAEGYQKVSIARSEKGVYFSALCKYWLRVWVLNESSGHWEWMLKHDKDLKPMVARHRFDQRVHAPWILEDINYNLFCSSLSLEDNSKPAMGEILEWNSDNDDGTENEDMVDDCNPEVNKNCYGDIEVLGFHPYKEVVFLSSCARTGVAYHLNGSKTEVLGDIYPMEYDRFKELLNEGEEITSFPYTPCWIEEF